MKDIITQVAGLVPLFPLIGFLIISLLNKRLSKDVASMIACGALFASFVVSVILFLNVPPTGIEVHIADWINAGTFSASFSFLIDPLSCIFLLIITGVGFLIHVYSIGYMHDDDNQNIFFSYLNLFIFFMLMLVMGSSYLLMFVGWEGVGLCSYLLIGFWFKNKSYNDAAKKAFIMNRIGDLGFLIGMILIFKTFGTTDYKSVFVQSNGFSAGDATITAITLLLFVGAIGKSAQIPLYTWLPDAMAGPTPVSALIHAATMVTAGIYMVARSGVLFALAPTSMFVVGLIGAVTAVFAATIALTQNDIKKVLAYSTVSQLGYMFLALGVGAFSSSVFHVMTHAFFKALLFLGAGSVIHGLGGEQDIRKMGGLRSKMPVTAITFLLGTLAISGIPPFSGFFSKDDILAHAYASNKLFWILGLAGSMMTAFYMFRLYFLVFTGSFRSGDKVHAHESPKVMTIPLVILALLSTFGGFVGLPKSWGITNQIDKFLEPVFSASPIKMLSETVGESSVSEMTLMIVAVLAAVLFISWAYMKYNKNKEVPLAENQQLPAVQNILYHKYYIDEIYSALITKPLDKISGFLESIVETKFIDSIVNKLGTFVNWTGGIIRQLQTGNVDFYIFVMVVGVVLMIFFKIM
ncbi:MAG TPA: NADH-quinone oxidoreductase subunit L [Bacteroidia bacterium]|jgi:NADH-quinone oxidoreductase subunit L|nr:NADH-quinone oxidoreductase subunit L [Bacteroidia bacterium]